MSLELVLAALLLPSVAAANPHVVEGNHDAVVVESQGRNLTLDVDHRTPLADILVAIGEATGAEVIVRRDVGDVGPLHIVDKPAGEALRTIAGTNYIAIDYWNLDDPGFDYDTKLAGTLRRIVLMGPATYPVPGAGPPDVPVAAATVPEPEDEPAVDPAAEARDARYHRAALDHIEELGTRHDPADIEELRTIIETGEEPTLRRAAIGALGRAGDAAALQAIADAGLYNSDASVRLYAAKTLWRVQGAVAKPRLVTAAAIETDSNVRDGIQRLLQSVN